MAQTQSRPSGGLLDDKKKIVLGIAGDSTGNEEWEWVYRLCLWLGAETGYSVDYCLFSDGVPGDYGPVQRVHEGSLENTIMVYNCSVPGKGFHYPTASPRTIATIFPESPDIAVISYGYNHLSMGDEFGEQVRQLALDVNVLYPSTRMVFVAQPPKAPDNPDAISASLRSRSVETMSKKYGYALVDAYTAFETSGNLAALISSDGIHPNRQGETVWLEAAKETFASFLSAISAQSSESR